MLLAYREAGLLEYSRASRRPLFFGVLSCQHSACCSVLKTFKFCFPPRSPIFFFAGRDLQSHSCLWEGGCTESPLPVLHRWLSADPFAILGYSSPFLMERGKSFSLPNPPSPPPPRKWLFFRLGLPSTFFFPLQATSVCSFSFEGIDFPESEKFAENFPPRVFWDRPPPRLRFFSYETILLGISEIPARFLLFGSVSLRGRFPGG